MWVLICGCLTTGVGSQAAQEPCSLLLTLHDLDANGVTDMVSEWRYTWPDVGNRSCSSAGGYLYAESGVTLLGSISGSPLHNGTPIGLPPRGDLRILPAHPVYSSFPAMPFSDGRSLPLLGVAIESTPGSIRYGWLYLPNDPREIREIEFSPRPNEVIPLGLPPQPRWLPAMTGDGFEVPSPGAAALNRGTVVQFGRSLVNFDLGVSSVVSGADGWVYGVGRHSVASLEEPRSGQRLFRVRTSGGALEVLGDLGELPLGRDSVQLSATTGGLVFAAGPDLHRFDPASGLLTRLTESRAAGVLEFRTAPRPLSDGRLYATTSLGYARMDPDGTGIREFPRNSGGDGFTSEPVEDSEGWMNLASRNWIARSRPDGTRFHVRARLNEGPLINFLGISTGRTDLWRSEDGMLYGVVRVRGPRGVIFRLPSGKPPEILQTINDESLISSLVPFHDPNEPVGFTDMSPRSLMGRLIDQPDGFLYGQFNTWLGGAFRLRKTDGKLETLSQSSLLGSGEWSPGTAPGDPFIVPSRHGIASFAPGKHGVRLLRRLDGVAEDGQDPVGPLLPVEGGAILGVTRRGGFLDEGVLYRVQVDGSGFRVLHSFSGGVGDVLKPSGFLARGDDGWIYGTSGQGNHYEVAPALYRVHSASGGLHKLANLPGIGSPSDRGRLGLMRAKNGQFYGTTPRGGRANLGTLYTFDVATSEVRVLHEFGEIPEDRWQAWPELSETTDGWLYGLVAGQGPDQTDADGWFRIRLDGSDYQILSRIDRPNGQRIEISGGLSPDVDGSFLTVRSPNDSATHDTPVNAQILRLIPPGNGSATASVRIEYRQTPGEEPKLWPVGRLSRTSTGRWVGATRSPSVALFEFNPADGRVTRVSVFRDHESGLRETTGTLDPWTSALHVGGDSVLLAVGKFGPGGRGAVVRDELLSPNEFAALAETQWTVRYGDFLARPVPMDSLFTNAFSLIEVGDGPPGIESGSTGYGGHLTAVGEFESRVVATDGRWPERLATNIVRFLVGRRALTLTGPTVMAMVGDRGPFPEGYAEGLAHWETSVMLSWQPVAPDLAKPGNFTLEPILTAPNDVLRSYEITTHNGILTWVDPSASVEARAESVAIRFPEIPYVTYTIWQSDNLDKPEWKPIHVEHSPQWSGPYVVNLDGSVSARFFRVEARSWR